MGRLASGRKMVQARQAMALLPSMGCSHCDDRVERAKLPRAGAESGAAVWAVCAAVFQVVWTCPDDGGIDHGDRFAKHANCCGKGRRATPRNGCQASVWERDGSESCGQLLTEVCAGSLGGALGVLLESGLCDR